jgi:hypothetical protein
MPRTRAELEREIRRLQDTLSAVEDSRNVAGNDIGVAGRIAITRMRDEDYPDLVNAVEEIPNIAAQQGPEAALAYIRTTVRMRIDSLIFSMPTTGDLVRARHRLHAMLSEGQAELLWRRDRAGVRARADLLEAVERHAYAPSIIAAFNHGQETPAGITNLTPGGR